MKYPNSQLLAAFPCLRSVTAEEWAEAQPSVRRFPAKTAILQRDDAALFGMFLLSGTARINRIEEDGRESVMGILAPGQVCALLVLSGLSGRDYPGTIRAESEVEALFIAKRCFLGWLQTHDDIRTAVFGGLLDGMLRIGGQAGERRSEPLETRLAKALLRAASERGPMLRVTHHELAAEIGSVREVVSRALRRYRDRGWIETGRGWVRIVRRGGLEALLGDQVTEALRTS